MFPAAAAWGFTLGSPPTNRSMKQFLNLALFTLGVSLVYTAVGQVLPQLENRPPPEIKAGSSIGPDELSEAGAAVFEANCSACHRVGEAGRGPDLANIGAEAPARASKRAAETGADYTAGDYLIEALCRPGIYLVEGYANIMPPQANSLTGGQLLAAAAFLQTLGGEATIKGTDVESLDRFCNVAAGNVAADGSGATRAAAVAAAETGGFESADAIVAEFGCEACHNFEAPTRTLGPALLGVGGRLSKGELYEALLDPDATIPEAQPPFLKGLMKTTLTGNGFYKRMTPADYAMLIEWLSQK